MKKVKIFILGLIFVFSVVSCEKTSVEDEFESVNGQVVEKLIKRIEGKDAIGENGSILFNYNGDNKVSIISYGSTTTTFNYNSLGELISYSTTGYPGDEPKPFSMSELYQAPYDVFDNGEVLEKDNNNNPIKILVYDQGDSSKYYIGDILYDDKPNPFFYTIKSSSMLDVLDRSYLNFGYQIPEIVKAKDLLPNNIVTGMIFKDSDGITVAELQIDYTYDKHNYPIRGDVFIYEDGESKNNYINFYYK
ncbi:hypothetical protein [uncultured Lutibacter sp.]|uniref:hypothetical protein n=1 Tax=uncultured Lutibacter sp. TaxID=437739 RepID=UPI00260D9033|nr:hypothetical protein [uncultured Lutibacter sp.]